MVGENDGNPEIREARLRPEFADRYQWMRAGAWYLAATIASARLHEDPPPPRHLRLLPDEHFEFRGGTELRPTSGRTRRSDGEPPEAA
jgi:hypothetical protein